METQEIIEKLELEDSVKEKITPVIDEVVKTYKKELEESNSKLNEAIQTRQKAKDKLREYEAKIATGDYEGAKEIKSQLDRMKEENTSLLEAKTKLETDLENAIKEASTLKTQNDEFNNKLKETLKESFSDEKWEVVKDLPLEKISELAKHETKFNKDTTKKAGKFKDGDAPISREEFNNRLSKLKPGTKEYSELVALGQKSAKYW